MSPNRTSRGRIPWGPLWKLLGVAGLAGVAASGVVVARAERRRRAYTPDEVRARLQERAAAVREQAAQEQAAQDKRRRIKRRRIESARSACGHRAGCRDHPYRRPLWISGVRHGWTVRSVSWASAAGSSARTGARSTRPTRSPCCTPRPTTGVTFFDTADVYGDGRSERLVGRFLRERRAAGLTVATKMGRRVEQVPENYTRENFLAWNDRSRANLGVDTLDLVQLHCPPTPVYATDAVFDALDELVEAKRITAYGVSVETVDEALTAIARPGVASVQIIVNAFRQKPLERVLPAAQEAGVAVIARVPLASGPALGPLHRGDDVRPRRPPVLQPARRGVRRRRDLRRRALRGGARGGGAAAPAGARRACRWPGSPCGGCWTSRVTVVIPGARDAEQARGNAAAAALDPLPAAVHDAVREVYAELVAPHVHDRW